MSVERMQKKLRVSVDIPLPKFLHQKVKHTKQAREHMSAGSKAAWKRRKETQA